MRWFRIPAWALDFYATALPRVLAGERLMRIRDGGAEGQMRKADRRSHLHELQRAASGGRRAVAKKPQPQDLAAMGIEVVEGDDK